jgi:hypothetical protein
MTMINKRDIVIFIGAGFSFDAGLPVMSDFGAKSREDYDTLAKHAAKNERQAAQMFVEAADVFYDFQNACRRSPTLTSEDVGNLETVFCIAEAMKEAGLKAITLQDKVCTLDKLIEKIQLWLWKIYQQCPLLNPKRKTQEDTYIDFFGLFSELGIWNRTTAISMNYDLIFEYMSWKNNTPCAYPFHKLQDAVNSIRVGNGLRTFVHLNHDDLYRNSVLCKLHGSVNFFEYSSNSENQELCNSKLFVTNDLGGDKSIGDSGPFKNKPAIFAVDAISEIRKKYGQSLTPAIIPPTYAKLVGKIWLREIWNYALNALSEANTILFIGYSMPPTDGFMNALIHAAFATRKRINSPNIFVIDPNPQVHQNYSKLFGASYRDIGHHTLEWALKTGVLNQVLDIAI